jgi:hypothetical protein
VGRLFRGADSSLTVASICLRRQERSAFLIAYGSSTAGRIPEVLMRTLMVTATVLFAATASSALAQQNPDSGPGCAVEGGDCSGQVRCCAGLQCVYGELTIPRCQRPNLTDAGCLGEGGDCVVVELGDGGSYMPSCCGADICQVRFGGFPPQCTIGLGDGGIRGGPDAGSPDGGVTEAPDASSMDSGVNEAPDASSADSGGVTAGPDSGFADSGSSQHGPDSGSSISPDSGNSGTPSAGCGCSLSVDAAVPWALMCFAALTLIAGRRRVRRCP